MAEFEEKCPICGYEYCFGKDFENCERYQGDGKEMFFNMVTDFEAFNKAEIIEEKMKFCELQTQIVKCRFYEQKFYYLLFLLFLQLQGNKFLTTTFSCYSQFN